MAAALDKGGMAPGLEPKLAAALGFIEKLTLEPHAIGPGDVAPLRAAGLDDDAIEHAIQVCALFNTIDRIADALGFEVPPPEQTARQARLLLQRGYR